MRTINLSIILIAMTGCPVAKAYDVKDIQHCVIDQCDDDTCRVETPEGWVDIEKKSHHYEGAKIVCPIWLVEPT
jgi:hypothetical protein